MKRNAGNQNQKKGGIADEIAQLKQRREDRKTNLDKKNQMACQSNNDKMKISDEIFEKMMRKKKTEIYKSPQSQYVTSDSAKIFVVVRKRPISKKEITNGEIDCVSVVNPRIYVHECKIQIDGITKYLEDHEFYFDNSFGENNTTEDVYKYTINSMINLVLNQGIVTCFAYGQTGSGKTYTMKGIESLAIEALFKLSRSMNQNIIFYISFFEIYGGRLFDLLNNKNKLQVLDDKNGKVNIFGLEQKEARSPEEMHNIIDYANSIRTTRNTVTNETSSRSHAICNIVIKFQDCDEEIGKLSLVDLAGSERAQETQSNNRQRRAEGAEINKSLLALKECIRALDARKNGNPDQHIPFRASKLTHVLRDSFVSKSEKSKIIMIACVNPSYSSANHSINTLRYSDRLKEQTKQHQGGGGIANNQQQQMQFDNFNNNNNNNSNNNNYNQQINLNNYNNNRNNNYNNNSQQQQNNNNRGNNNNNINKQQQQQQYYNNNNNKPQINNPFNSNQNNRKDDNINDIDLSDKMDLDDNSRFETPNKFIPKNNNSNNHNDNNDDWDYLRKTANRDGKMLSEEYIKYHQLTDKLVEDEDEIINTHMYIIKDDAKLLTEEGDLITNIKGVGKEEDFKMDEYISGLDRIINRKLAIYSDLKRKVDVYKKHIKEEDDLRSKLNPKYFIDDDI